jgi:CDP-glucose 4,6-dehydratase
MSVIEMTRRILSLMGREDLEPVILNQARAEIRDQYLDSTKAARMLGWTPAFDVDDALRRTIGWYREFLAHARSADAGQPPRPQAVLK